MSVSSTSHPLPKGICFKLVSPDCDEDPPSLQRRAVDAWRRGWTLESGLPCGVYLSEDVLVLHGSPADGMASSQASASESAAAETESQTSAQSIAGTDWSAAPGSENTGITSDDDDDSLKDVTDSVDVSQSEDSKPMYSAAYIAATMTSIILDQASSTETKNFYSIELLTRQEHPDYVGGSRVTSFLLEIDTGSNTTWVRGENVRKIVKAIPAPAAERSGGRGRDRSPSGYVIERFAWNDMRGKSCLLNHNIFIPNVPPDSTTEMTSWDGRVRYGSRDGKRVVLLGRLPRDLPRKFTIPHSYSWTKDASWRDPIELYYAPAVAICGTEDLILRARFGGLLGLGTLKHQDAFAHALRAPALAVKMPSFAWKLVDSMDTVPEERGIIMYFLLRPQPSSEDGTQTRRVKSYLALQSWPCRHIPRWSPQLRVIGGSRYWKLFLKSIKIWSDVEATTASAESLRGRIPASHTEVNIAVILDTGASSSYIPASRHQTLVSVTPFLFGTPLGTSTSQLPAPFYLSESRARNRETTVELLFSDSGRTISVYVPALGFLYNAQGEGLVWPWDARRMGDGAEDMGLLGLNFFHVVYAAFHIPEEMDPYIRLAPQSRREAAGGRYDVPEEATSG